MPPESKDKPDGARTPFQRSLLDPDAFTITFELVPSRGGRSRQIDRTLDLAAALARDGRIRAVSITDNAGGSPALSPEVLGLEIKAMGLDVISHFSCKDKNRNEMESQLFGWDRRGLHNLLVISGDYPKEGYAGHPKPVFDLDSVHVVDMLRLMNQGRFLHHENQRTAFFTGVAVSPFKLTEAEQVMQYAKLHRKVAAGANFVITQLGWDARKYHEVLLVMRQHGLHLPVLGSVFVPSLGLAEIMYRGGVPGCIVAEELYREMEKEGRAADKGKMARLTRAAKLLAVLRHMGYNGAHIGGVALCMEDFDFMLTRAAEYLPQAAELIRELSFWPKQGFYLYRKNEETGLNAIDRTPCKADSSFHPVYELARLVHHLAFEPDSPLFPLCRTGCLALHSSCLARPSAALEHLAKFLLFACQNCGDCTLASHNYLCPQSGCAKYLLNGPCGGSRDGWCEVYPGEKKCLYVRVYERNPATAGIDDGLFPFEPPRNWQLNNSSSWANFYQGKDRRGGAARTKSEKKQETGL
ncbi:MAG: methylenetetrahydrofolate reductase C-terminal domain-containing protein [Thermodesulfobacteriota bacterium]